MVSEDIDIPNKMDEYISTYHVTHLTFLYKYIGGFKQFTYNEQCCYMISSMIYHNGNLGGIRINMHKHTRVYIECN